MTDSVNYDRMNLTMMVKFKVKERRAMKEKRREEFQTFYALEEKKRQKIINAAMKEFANKGYDLASTNEIVKNAEISKGALFHYFNNKEDLYWFLFDELMVYNLEVEKKINWGERDLFGRLYQIGVIKYEIAKKYPYLFEFATSVFRESNLEIKRRVDRVIGDVKQAYMKMLYENIDFSKFREDLPIEMMLKVLNWSINGMGEENKIRRGSFEEIAPKLLEEWKQYLDFMKKCFYK